MGDAAVVLRGKGTSTAIIESSHGKKNAPASSGRLSANRTRGGAGAIYVKPKAEHSEAGLRKREQDFLKAMVAKEEHVQQKLMRHSDIRTTMNIYGDAATEDMREAHSKIARLALQTV